ncbi:MAG: TonB C-terminal domain-containing protein [Myxococcales bacterium]
MKSGLPTGRLGLAMSVVIHAAIAAWLLRLPVPKEPTSTAVQFEVIVGKPKTRIVDTPPAPQPLPPSPPAEPPRVETQRRTKPAAPKPVAEVPRPTPAAVPPSEPSPPAPEAPAQATAAAEPGQDLPRAANLDLSLRAGSAATAASTATDGIPVVRRQLRLDPASPGERSPSELITAGQAKRRVENGLVDPYFAQLGKALIDHWDADSHVQRSGVRGWMQQMSENTELLGALWQKNAKKFARTGNLVSDSEAGGYAIPTVVDRTGGLTARAARDAYDRQLKEQFTARKRALFRVVQNGDGTLRSVTLVEGSNEPSIDRDALADVRAAASRLPPPPPDGLGIKEPIVSLWEFQLTVSISPPIPTVTIEFDEALAYLDARMPLDRRIYKRVKLVAVE